MAYTVEYYEKANGECPVEEFILSQEKKMRSKILGMLEILEEKGPELREPYSKSLGSGIFELRVKQGSDSSRILYFFIVGKTIILTNGFLKKTQKTPPNEIALAKRYRTNYQHRQREGE